ncbi:CHAT domain-containing protein [Crucibulum laeve]|uniref:CHAT domain-containing protein n=1 Tax=Crucibulum laeve TaxID=68775 RepID=A0A5C3LWG5_9AGAR|nr:CHAT domain-containing protein [Crucibulum laeve]
MYLRNPAYIPKAVAILQKAVQCAPDSHPHKPIFLVNLANGLKTRFQFSQKRVDLEGAIDANKQALELYPQNGPEKVIFLTTLADSFGIRFLCFGEESDLKKAIENREHAKTLMVDKHPINPMILSNLGDDYRNRFHRYGDDSDLDTAVDCKERALEIIPDHDPGKIEVLGSLGNILSMRFRLFGAMADFDKALRLFEMVAKLNLSHRSADPEMHDDMEIGTMLGSRFDRNHNVADIKKAIVAGKAALKMIENDLYQRPIHLSNLATAYLSRFEQLHDITDGITATEYFKAATESSTGGALEKFRAAVKWASCASKVPGISSLDAYTCAIDLLPQVASLGLPIKERHRELANIGSAARDAAAAAIKSREYAKAVEWLDQGRSIVWSQLLRLRSFPDKLRDEDLVLASRLERVATLLEVTSIEVERPDLQPLIGSQRRPIPKQKPFELLREWGDIVKSVQKIEGFQDFLLPKKLSQLKGAARLGTVVVINVHHSRCDALILKHNCGEDVIHVPLQFSIKQSETLRSQLDAALSHSDLRVRGDRPAGNNRSNNGGIKDVLSELWKHIVKPVLAALDQPVSKPSELPRIWWCATGPLAFLPLHAAGLYNDEPGSSISDYFVSSYTPTLTALLEEQKSTAENPFQILTIAQPVTSGHKDLPKTRDELRRIHKHACGKSGNTIPFISLGVDGEDATVERVIQYMSECAWVHLACHGTQNIADPTKSALILHSGKPLEVFEIIKNPLPNAEFVFMSACQTARGDNNLPDEAVHLAASMLLAGYRGVIATMWSIKDADGPIIADDVYGCLFSGKRPDHTQAAHALHEAVKKLRDDGASFDRWVPFIHVGI